MLPNSLKFLTSNRFWALILTGIVQALGKGGYLSPDIVSAFLVILGGFIGIRTVDRFSEKLSERKS